MTGAAKTENDELSLDIREHARHRVPVPFTCALSEGRTSRWFAKKRTGIGVVYDVSIRGARVASEAPLTPGDHVTMLLRLPKQGMPLAVASATIRWAKDQMFGLEFTDLTSTAALRLTKYLSLSLSSPA